MEEKKGVKKKKGAAESKELTEDGPVIDVADKGVAKKKGAAQGSMATEKTAKQLKAEGKKLKQEARDKKKADKKASRATKKSNRKTKKSKRLQDKIDLQTLKKSQTDDTVIKGKKSNRITNLEKRKAKADKGTDREVKAGVAKKKGAANYEDGYPPTGSGKKKGASKKKGAAEYSVELGSHPDSPKHGAHKGVGRMGFTQNFGPARQNSYAKGAARVAQIMGKGAADPKPGKPHTHSGVEIGSGATNELEGVTLSPKANRAYKTYQTEDYAAGRGPSTPNPNVAGGSIPGKYPKMDAVRGFGSNNKLSRGMRGNAPIGTSSNPQNEKSRNNLINELTNFMGVPTNSQRMVNEKIETMKSGTDGNLITDIRGTGKKKNSKKKH